jgi:hypothetical protein
MTIPRADARPAITIREADAPPSRLAALLRSPRALGALAALYATLPSLLSATGDGLARLRVVTASGALLAAVPSLLAARRLQPQHRGAVVLFGSFAGALVGAILLALAFGETPRIQALLSWGLLFPALAYAASTMLALAAIGAGDEDRSALPICAALLFAAFGLVPLSDALAGARGVAWYPYMGLYWTVAGGSLWFLLLALGRWCPGTVDRVTRAVGRRVLGLPAPAFLAGVALFAAAASAAIALLCFGRQPHNADEVAQLWHAKILLSGHLSLPADPNPEFFGMDNVIDQGRWYSQFPIGGPAFLALGLLARAAWLVNPVLLALTVPNVYRFTQRAYDETVARSATLLFALSPMVLFMGASFMNHVPVLWLVSVALAQLPVWIDAEDRADAFRAAGLIGLTLGVAATVRPLDAALVAVVVGALQLGRLRGSAVRRRSLVVQTLAGAVPVLLLLAANAETTGSALRFGYDVLYGSAHNLGFHVDPYGAMHTPVRGLSYFSKYLLQLDVSLLEAPLPAVGIIVAGLLFLRRESRWDRLLLALVVVQLAGYAAYWHEGDFRGPRFLFGVMPALVVLVARAPFVVAGATRGATRRAALLILPICVLCAWTASVSDNSVPGRVRGYRAASPVGFVDPDSVARQAGLHHALVFVSEGFEQRSLRRLWGLGISHADAMRLMVSVPPCAMRRAIAEAASAPAVASARVAWMLERAASFRADEREMRACASDLVNGGDGVASYAPFFPANSIGIDGRLDGEIVYALDLGEHDEALRARFGDRTWYRFGPHESAGDRVPRLTAYSVR